MIVSTKLPNDVECRVVAELAYIRANRNYNKPTSKMTSATLSQLRQSDATVMTGNCRKVIVSKTEGYNERFERLY